MSPKLLPSLFLNGTLIQIMGMNLSDASSAIAKITLAAPDLSTLPHQGEGPGLGPGPGPGLGPGPAPGLGVGFGVCSMEMGSGSLILPPVDSNGILPPLPSVTPDVAVTTYIANWVHHFATSLPSSPVESVFLSGLFSQ